MTVQVHRREGTSRIETAFEADALLDDLHVDYLRRSMPAIVDFVAEGRALGVGVGAKISCLLWSDSRFPFHYFALGDRCRSIAIQFIHGGGPTEVISPHLVSHEVARQAVREFVLTKERPTSPSWDEPDPQGKARPRPRTAWDIVNDIDLLLGNKWIPKEQRATVLKGLAMEFWKRVVPDHNAGALDRDPTTSPAWRGALVDCEVDERANRDQIYDVLHWPKTLREFPWL